MIKDGVSGIGVRVAATDGMTGDILISLLVIGAARRLVALAGFGIAAGLGLTLVQQTWFDFLQGISGSMRR